MASRADGRRNACAIGISSTARKRTFGEDLHDKPRSPSIPRVAGALLPRDHSDLHQNPSPRRKSIDQILGDRIDDEGGTLLYAMESEED
jgi:hypothetical protein